MKKFIDYQKASIQKTHIEQMRKKSTIIKTQNIHKEEDIQI